MPDSGAPDLPAGLETRPPRARKSPLRRATEIAASLAVVGLLFGFVIPEISGSEYGDVWEELRKLSAFELVVLIAVSVLSIVSYGWVLMSVLPGLTFVQGVVVNQASTAVSNVVPLGGALGVGVTYGMLASWGFSLAAITLSILVSGFWNVFMKLGFPVVGLVLLAFEGEVSTGVAVVTGIGVGVLVGAIATFVLVLRSERLAARIGTISENVVSAGARLIRRPRVRGWDRGAVRFRRQSIDLVRTRWPQITASNVLFNVALYAVLLLCLRFLGVDDGEISWIQVFAAFSFSRLLSTLAITPGGVGFVEAGALGLLTAGFEGQTAPVTGAVLLWRALTFFLPIPLGAAGYVTWGVNRRWRRQGDAV